VPAGIQTLFQPGDLVFQRFNARQIVIAADRFQ
jgi:hypothetical protein